MRGLQSASIKAAVRTKLGIEFPKYTFDIVVSRRVIGYRIEVKWHNGPAFVEVEDMMNKYMKSHKNIREINHKCTYDDEDILKEAQAIADKSWIKIPLNMTNIHHLKTHDVTLLKLALDSLRHKSFKPTATLK